MAQVEQISLDLLQCFRSVFGKGAKANRPRTNNSSTLSTHLQSPYENGRFLTN